MDSRTRSSRGLIFVVTTSQKQFLVRSLVVPKNIRKWEVRLVQIAGSFILLSKSSGHVLYYREDAKIGKYYHALKKYKLSTRRNQTGYLTYCIKYDVQKISYIKLD